MRKSIGVVQKSKKKLKQKMMREGYLRVHAERERARVAFPTSKCIFGKTQKLFTSLHSFLTNLMGGQEIQNLISKQKIEMHLVLKIT